MKTKQHNLRMSHRAIELIAEQAKKDDRSPGYWLSRYIEQAFDGKPKQKKTGLTSVEPLNFDSWPQMPDVEMLAAWLKSKKKAGGSVTQQTMNTVGRELHIAASKGFTVYECLSEAEDRSWKGFKSFWMENTRNETRSGHSKPVTEADRVKNACDDWERQQCAPEQRGEREINDNFVAQTGG